MQYPFVYLHTYADREPLPYRTGILEMSSALPAAAVPKLRAIVHTRMMLVI